MHSDKEGRFLRHSVHSLQGNAVSSPAVFAADAIFEALSA